jgi:hypothetical protein
MENNSANKNEVGSADGIHVEHPNILPGMRRKVSISTLMVFRNQRRRRRRSPIVERKTEFH